MKFAELRHRIIPFTIIAIGSALLVGLFLVFTQRLEDLRDSPGESLTWTLSQVEVDVLQLVNAAESARNNSQRDYSTLRRRFDNAYSRISNIQSSPGFSPLRSDPEFSLILVRLQTHLDNIATLIDGPDDQLAAQFDIFDERIAELRSDTRNVVLRGLSQRAEISERDRISLRNLLFAVEILTGALILFLCITMLVILRQYHRNSDFAQELSRANERLKSSFDVSQDAIIVADSGGIILDFNKAAEEVFGYTIDEVVGVEMSELIIPQDSRAAHLEGMARYNKTGTGKIVDQGRIEIIAEGKARKEFPVEISIGTATDQRGTIFISYVRDITKRRAAEEALKKARDEALKAEQAQSNFMAVMSHEMRTPLNGIFGALELLKDTRLSKAQEKFVTIAQQSGDVVLYHVNNVLDVTRLEADELKLEEDAFDVSDLFRDIVAVNTPMARSVNNKLRLDLGTLRAVYAKGDKHRIRQVAYNLISNALKFTHAGNVVLSVAVSKDPGLLEFSVRDTGVGIRPEDHDKVFERFYTQAQSYDRIASGAGLGLSICKLLVDLMGGTLRLESSLGVGSTFTVEIPIEIVDPPKIAASVPSSSNDAAALAGAHILLVEDNAINREIVQQMLVTKGLKVTTAVDGREAIQLAQEEKFAAILMDISMPILNGVETTKILRNTKTPNKHTPILALTAHALPVEQEKFIEAGMEFCINKPVSQADLSAALTAAINVNDGAEEAQEVLIDTQVVQELKSIMELDRIQQLLTSFGSEIGDFLGTGHTQLDTGDFTDFHETAHRIAGAAGLIGVVKLHKHLSFIEEAGRAEDTQAARTLLLETPKLWDKTREQLEVALSTTS